MWGSALYSWTLEVDRSISQLEERGNEMLESLNNQHGMTEGAVRTDIESLSEDADKLNDIGSNAGE